VSSVHDIDEGYTQDYLVHGVVALAVAGIMLLVHWSWTIVLGLLAVALFAMRSGIEIDVPGKRARVYKALLKWKFGEWLKTPTFSRIELIYTNEAQVMNYKSISTNVRTRTYELVLQGGVGDRLLFHEFTDYSKARKSADIMAQGWGLTLVDDVEVMKQRARQRAEQRRR